jgi:Tol biopolymer transport system component
MMPCPSRCRCFNLNMAPNNSFAPAPIASTPPSGKRRKWSIIVGAGVLFFSCSQPSNSTATSDTYGNPELVTLKGYSGSQEDPKLSPDGQYLFFDSHNDAGQPMYLYYAKRIDYKTFQFMGKVPGVDHEGVDGTEDAAHNFYFVWPGFLGQGGITIGQGIFSGDSVTDIAPVQGISPKAASSGSRAINFDIFITPDGDTLYFSDFMVNTSGAGFSGVQGAQLSMAIKNADGSFTRAPNSDEILKNVNATGKLVYNATPSADGLAFAFNAAPYFGPHPRIYIATRSSTSDPFGMPELVTAADEVQGQFSEPGSFSPDGTYLYFHRVLSDSASQLYVLTRQ